MKPLVRWAIALPSHVRNALVGPTAWIAVLAVGIVVPILAITVLFVHDIDRLTAAARTERLGIAEVAALSRLFRDASAYRAARACDPPTDSTAALPRDVEAIERDVAALNALERARSLLGRAWTRAARRWDARGDALRRAGGLTAGISPLFVTISDRSGMTFDPEVAGIDVADALAYRLPRAIDHLQHAELLLCAAPGAPGDKRLIALARASGAVNVLLDDAYAGDVVEAAGLDPTLRPAVGRSEKAAAAATSAALALLARVEVEPSAPLARRARAATARADAALYALIDTLGPALDRIATRRIGGLRHRFYLTLVPGILAMVAAALFVLLGARNVLGRADLARMTRTAAELGYHATHDALTDLANRAAFVTSLQEAIAATASGDGAAAVLFIDLDDFKLVNDSLGHAAGDIVLCAVAGRLRAICDDARGTIIARFGGDEFAMLVHEPVGALLAERVDRIVSRIVDALAQPVPLGPDFQQRIAVSASIGIAAVNDGKRTATQAADVLRDADVAMYEAKAGGRGGAVAFGPAMRERAVRKLRLMTDLRGAADRAEFTLTREPIVRLRDGTRVGSEALIRWQHPRLGLLAPSQFLPLAEESGAIVHVGNWVLQSAVDGLSNPANGFVHVNLSARDLTEETLLETVATLLDRHAVAPNSLAIEITERSLVRSGGRAEAMLGRLRSLGVRIWIDDFGVEYSSLRYLDRLPVDGVKIDASFIAGHDGGLASPAIVKMMIELAASLGLDVIAEGIETSVQRDALLAIGCVYGQGFFYSRAAGSAAAGTVEPESAAAGGTAARPVRRSDGVVASVSMSTSS